MVSRPVPLGPECLSDFRVDALLLGGLSADALDVAKAHVATCARCEARTRTLRETYAAEALPALPALSALSARSEVAPNPTSNVVSLRRWVGGVTSALALAACVLLLLRSDRAQDTTDTVRMKGGDKVAFFVEHKGKLRAGYANERVEPGDKLQFAYSARQPVHVVVLSLDGARKVSLYVDDAGELPATTGNDVRTLATSVLLDDVLGSERIWGLVCKERQDGSTLQRQLDHEKERFTPPVDCITTEWTLLKEKAAP